MKRLLLGLLVACAGPGAAASGPTEVVIPIASAAGAQASPPPSAKKRSGGCTVAISTKRVEMSSPTCYLDQHVEDGGILTYPCSGEDGEVTAAFDKTQYKGTLRSGEVELEARTELDWPGDACRWGTIGTIRGTLLEQGELTRQKLQWTYADRVVSGNNCSGVCRATAIFDVSPTE